MSEPTSPLPVEPPAAVPVRLTAQELKDRLELYLPVLGELNRELVPQIPKATLLSWGERLGLVHQGRVFLQNDRENAVLLDTALYHYRRNGRTLLDDMAESNPPEAGSPKASVLNAMRHARFTCLRITDRIPGLGIGCRDMMMNEDVVVLDNGFSRTGVKGLIFAARLIDFDGAITTTGGALPVTREAFDAVQSWILQMDRRFKSRKYRDYNEEQRAELATGIIRVLLQRVQVKPAVSR